MKENKITIILSVLALIFSCLGYINTLPNNEKLENGKSAYEIAVEHGFVGSETEWLESLEGKDGQDGSSAYEVAVKNGFKGTEQEWLMSLISNGNENKSAYESAVEQGYDKSVEDFAYELFGSKNDEFTTIALTLGGQKLYSFVNTYADTIHSIKLNNTDSIKKLENLILSIIDTTGIELFNGFSKTDFFLKRCTLNDGTNTIVPIYSNTNNSRMVVIELVEGATYHIKIKNNGGANTNRMRIVTYNESLSNFMIAPLASEQNVNNINPNKVSKVQDIIYYDDPTGPEAANSYEGTFVNESNAKLLIMMVAWGTNPDLVEVSVKTDGYQLNENVVIGKENLNDEILDILNEKPTYEPWQGYLGNDVYSEQDIINMTNILTSNMTRENKETQAIMEIAYNFWKHRDEFIYCSGTALDQPWNYWSYTGYVDSANTGKTVTAENAGYKRIDCSTFVRYVINGIDYYSTPYYNALELTTVEQGGLDNGSNIENEDSTICRTGKMYVRPNKKLILEAKDSNYSFTKIFGYNSKDECIQILETTNTNTQFVPNDGVIYLRAEMKVNSSSDYKPASKGVPAAILKVLRIRENERLEVNAEIPLSGYRNANQMCKWFDENGYDVEFNKYFYSDNDFKVGSVIYWGRTSSTHTYKNITHVSLYIGSGYIMHVSAPYGLVHGEAILIHPMEQLFEQYSVPMAGVSSPKYHQNYESK